MATDEQKIGLKHEVGQAFTPSASINEKDLFAGRRKQIQDILNTVNQRGQHAIVFGERGVGKTSLANVLAGFFSGAGINKTVLAPREQCHSADTFPSLWQRIFKKIKDAGNPIGFGKGVENNQTLADLYETTHITPDVVRDALAKASEKYLLIIIIDEFDRFPEDKLLLADTIKALSDYAVKATLVIVGVADSWDQLIAGHESIQRNLVQIPMPRMSTAELRQIVTDRLPRINMTINDNALGKICSLSRGLPHYTHLMAQHSAWVAIDVDSSEITVAHVDDAIKEAINNSQQTVKSAYHKATTSPRTESLFKQVLLACALAPCDEFGYFAAADVRGPMSDIMKKPYEIPQFIGHLGKFCEESRGEILQEMGERYQRRFRFDDPLMQPHIVMRGVASGMITLDQLQDAPENGA